MDQQDPGVEARGAARLPVAPIAAPSPVGDSGDRCWGAGVPRAQVPEPVPRCGRSQGAGKENPSALDSAFTLRSPSVFCISSLLPISFLI